jgi:TPR repeat protein
MSTIAVERTSTEALVGSTFAPRRTRANPPAIDRTVAANADTPDLTSFRFRPSGNWTNNLGIMYATGAGVAQDFAKAAGWYRESADRKGDANAQYNVGIAYYNGRGDLPDHREAARWFRKAAEQGDACAQSNLGYMYEYGLGVQQDDTEAKKWYRKPAQVADTTARSKPGAIAPGA